MRPSQQNPDLFGSNVEKMLNTKQVHAVLVSALVHSVYNVIVSMGLLHFANMYTPKHLL